MDNNNMFNGTPENSTGEENATNPYASVYDSNDAQNPYASPYTSQDTYTSANDTQSIQGAYSSAYGAQDTQSTQGAYSSAYGAQDAQTTQRPYQSYLESQNNQGNQYAYESQINSGTDTSYSFGNQNTRSEQNNQDSQNAQNAGYTYGSNMNNGAPNYYAGDYVYNGQNTAYQGYQSEMEESVPMSEWILLLCMTTFIPCVGLIMSIVWAFSKTEKKSKVNFCKAYLVIELIRLILIAVVFIVYGGIILAYFS